MVNGVYATGVNETIFCPQCPLEERWFLESDVTKKERGRFATEQT